MSPRFLISYRAAISQSFLLIKAISMSSIEIELLVGRRGEKLRSLEAKLGVSLSADRAAKSIHLLASQRQLEVAQKLMEIKDLRKQIALKEAIIEPVVGETKVIML